ncbi:ribonucleoside-diphosphate reductase subunit beta [Erythrobacter phage vB_EliS-L02]|nr:ribonucleoside-diphosphate reductase subunit beta [Erythrobacter phage vB_EliS-L02]
MQRIVVYTKEGCPFCSLLKMEMNKRGLAFDQVDLSDDSNRQRFYDRVGVNTVPQVFLADEDHTVLNPTGTRLGGWSEVSRDWKVFDNQ